MQCPRDRDLSTFEQLCACDFPHSGAQSTLFFYVKTFVNYTIIISFGECYVNAKLHCCFVLLEWIESTQNERWEVMDLWVELC